MAVWADNIKFVREIIESKFNKIDNSVAEVRRGGLGVVTTFNYCF